jgi:hypothetical protein
MTGVGSAAPATVSSAYRPVPKSVPGGRHMVTAAHDLTKALARGNGDDTDEVRHTRAESARIRALG